MCARPASSSTLSGSAACSCAQASTFPSGSAAGGTGCSMNCACPPSRCGDTTIRRATALATSLPNSCRSRYRQASIPAAVPALVITGPAST